MSGNQRPEPLNLEPDNYIYSQLLNVLYLGVRNDVKRTHLKNVFWPNIFVGAWFQILDIQQYACGYKLGPAAILNQNPIFEIGSK